MEFDINCQQCIRLSEFLRNVKREHADYYCKPVPAFGDDNPKLLIVGLAPGKHGANRTGRPFTGDYAGKLLYETLHNYGYSNLNVSTGENDGLELRGCRITNAVKCLPPENKPTTAEINSCNAYLQTEIQQLPTKAVILALGKIAHDAVLKSQSLKLSAHKFVHGAQHQLDQQRIMIDSYHCSRYNTQTKRLTEAMFHHIFDNIRILLQPER